MLTLTTRGRNHVRTARKIMVVASAATLLLALATGTVAASKATEASHVTMDLHPYT